MMYGILAEELSRILNNGFIKYNSKLFAWKDQERLAAYIMELRRLGAYYVLTNAKHKSIVMC